MVASAFTAAASFFTGAAPVAEVSLDAIAAGATTEAATTVLSAGSAGLSAGALTAGLQGAAAATTILGALSKKSDVPPPPTVTPPAVQPTLDPATAQVQQQRALAIQLGGGGRASTIAFGGNSGAGQTLGGG